MSEIPRCLGSVQGRAEGPTVVITGGLHGNEPAGVRAARAVLDELSSLSDVLRGRVVAFSGNRPALARGTRFVSRDLNRGWSSSHLERLRAGSLRRLVTEDREQLELHEAFLEIERDSSRVVFFDLHSTSGPSEPFVCLTDTADNRGIASALPVAGVLGLDKTVTSSMLSWCVARGHVGISFEAGQHDDPATQQRHISAVWTLLVAVAAIDEAHVPGGGAKHRAELSMRGRRRLVEVRHRHVVEVGDDFEMAAGMQSFDPIEAGQIVARDRRGPVRTPESGLMLMPRYQGQGEDGFFVAREIPIHGEERAP